MPTAAPEGGSGGGTSAAAGWTRHGFRHTTAFRITLWHLALTLVGTLALSGVAWWATAGFAARQLAQQIERDTGILRQAASLSGLRGVALSIEARIASDRQGSEYYLLTGPDGRRIVGNLAEAPLQPGWQSLRLRQAAGAASGEAGGGTIPLLALGTILPGGVTLVVARDLSPVEALEERLLGAAGWVGGVALLLGLAGGLLMGRGVARRAAAMAAALAAVEAGDLARRLPVRHGAGDEFDRLAARINTTLDRLQGLMAALREVTDDIAHDLRTPLSHLRQRLEAAGAAETPAAWQAAAEAAIADCDAILEVFAALLRIAQVESGAQRAAFARFDLSAAVEAVAEAYAPAAEERGQAFAASIAPGLPAHGDRTLISQLLANLLENAVRHGREGGHVALRLTPAAAGGAVLEVTDDGPGIPATERERVLRRFHRLDAARSTPGSGLGLALVKAVADLHGLGLTLGDADPTGLCVRVDIPPPPAAG
jgi:signal transduction histidine kinase